MSAQWLPGAKVTIYLLGGMGQPTSWGITGPALKRTELQATVVEPAPKVASDAWWLRLDNGRRVAVRQELPLILALEETTTDVVASSALSVIR